MLAEQTIYGEGLAEATNLNLLGKPYQQYDAAGIVTNGAYDFKGNLLNSTRELLTNYKDAVDWSLSPAPTLTGEIFTASSTFDALNRSVTLTSPDRSVTRPTYDQAGVLVQVSVNLQGAATATSFVNTIEYDAKGQRTLIQLGNGAQTGCTYDPNTFRLTSLTTTRSSDSAILQALSYFYDPIGNITHIQDSAQETVFFANQIVSPDNDYVYDAIYRLIQATGREAIGLVSAPQTTWDDSARMRQALPLSSDAQALRVYTDTYAYDSVGNFLSLVHGAANGNWTRTYAYDQPNQPPTNNRLTSTTIGAAQESYSYDVHGNMLTMPHLPTMAWDFKDQLQETETRVDNTSPVETTYYIYDASGQRVRKIVGTASGGTTFERIYLGGFELYREYDVSGATALERQTLHVMDDKQRVAMVETLTKGEDQAPRQLIRYEFANQLGSACLELDETAAIISYEEYYSYGSTSYQALNAKINATAKRYRFTGTERDEGTGFNYHGARYYAPWIGRWTSCDPMWLIDGNNLYSAVQNNPITFTDASGTDSEEEVPPPQGKVYLSEKSSQGSGQVIAPDTIRTGEVIETYGPTKSDPGPAIPGPDTGMTSAPAPLIPDPPHDATGNSQSTPQSSDPVREYLSQDFDPKVSDPAALRRAEGYGHLELGDITNFAKGVWNGPSSWLPSRWHVPQFKTDPEYARASEVGKEFGQDLASEGIGEAISLAAKALPAKKFLLKALGAVVKDTEGTYGSSTKAVKAVNALTSEAKNTLRTQAREIVKQSGRKLRAWEQVHHRIPLQYAHLFPNFSPNRPSNLAVVNRFQHVLIHLGWRAWEQAYAVTARNVKYAEEVIAESYPSWKPLFH